MFVALCFAGCAATPKVVTVTEYKERVVHDTVMKIDSVQVADSIVDKQRERLSGDTIFIEREVERWRTRWRTRVETQTVEVHHADSVPYPVEVVKEVPKKLNGWQRFIYGSGYAFWSLLVLIAISLITLGILKLRRVI
jgi:hypothetical protein